MKLFEELFFVFPLWSHFLLHSSIRDETRFICCSLSLVHGVFLFGGLRFFGMSDDL